MSGTHCSNRYWIKPEYSLEWIPVTSTAALVAFLNWTEYKCEVRTYD